MNDLEKKLIDAYATLVMGGKMDISEVPDKLILIEGGVESTMRAEVDAEVAKRIVEKLNQPEPEPTITEQTIQRIDAVEMAVAGLMEMLLMVTMPPVPEIPEEPVEGGE